MTKVKCGCILCEHSNDDGYCTCEEVFLNYGSVCTTHSGAIDHWVCRQYKSDETTEYLEELINKMVESRDD